MWQVRRVVVMAIALSSVGAAAFGSDYFIESDDYEEGEEIKGTFLGDAEYRIMIEELERNGVEFDWGWALTPGWSDSGETAPKKRGRRSGPKTVQEPRQLAFDIKSYSRAYVAPVIKSVGIVDADLLPAIQEYFQQALQELGVEVVDSPEEADLTLGLALVDHNNSTTSIGFYGIRVEPFVELELRLQDPADGGRDLLLLRNQAHGEDVTAAALRYANLLIQFLR